MGLNRKQWAGIAVAVVLVAGGIVAATIGWSRYGGSINALEVDLEHPQAYVSTPALSRLPRDLIKAPVLRDVLTEDFAFYYEEHESRLGLQGALKRIAFEHDTTLGDKLIELALDEPAEMAFWTDAKGAPRHWVMAMTRGVLARTLQGAAALATNDRQFSVIAQVRVNGDTLPVYALTLSSRRTLALVAQGNRVVVLSDPGLLFDGERQADAHSRDIVAALLSADAKTQAVYRRGFGLGEPGNAHTIVADARLMSFGYQHFFPGLRALRFDVAPGGAVLATKLRVDGLAALPAAPADRALWSAVPANPAACTLLPADWTRARAVAGATGWPALADQLDGPAAICWYPRSQFHTPLVVAQLREGAADPSATLDALTGWLLPAKAAALSPAARTGAQRWQREVSAPWGPHGDAAATTYRPTLARQGRWLTFSPDDALVDQALDAQARRFPSVADSLPVGPATLAVIAPRQVADLARREAFEVLPPEQELFRRAAERQLVPRLDALGKLPTARAVAAGTPDAEGWVAVEWQSLSALKTR
ncbi:DUF2138 family protein [Rhizobacter sp. OV335]|uniref:DUF2138 family protein n=1 Tax=Rhizobacter sp. OV335 TaxID=1500264 RepID=UPI0013566BD5|nr:DUF2138 family protein [Rhizobacter sp. OV335]